jgi:hypothetical protein
VVRRSSGLRGLAAAQQVECARRHEREPSAPADLDEERGRRARSGVLIHRP